MEPDRSHHHPRFSFASLRKRIEQNLSCAIAGGGSLAVSVAGAGGARRTESGSAGLHSQTSEKIAPRTNDGGDEFRVRRRHAGDRIVSRARPAYARTALRM